MCVAIVAYTIKHGGWRLIRVVGWDYMLEYPDTLIIFSENMLQNSRWQLRLSETWYSLTVAE